MQRSNRKGEGLTLTDELARKLADIILPSIRREYPNQMSLRADGDGDVLPPRRRTPAFCGCFDWHSAVHGHWALARLVRACPDAGVGDAIADALAAGLSEENLAGELAHLERRPDFEMPYGVAWLLQLAAEIAALAGSQPIAATWRDRLAPLEALCAERMSTWLSRLTHPIRTGEHNQTAFAIGLLLDWARARDREEVATAMVRCARRLYGDDTAAPLAYEPSAHDFLSPSLAEADLMARALAADEFPAWLSRFLPQLTASEAPPTLAPVRPVDRSNGKLVHFDGLNLSRAWMLRRIASALPANDPRRLRLLTLEAVHGRAGLGGVSGDHYAGAHWLGTFAVYWLTSRTE